MDDLIAVPCGGNIGDEVLERPRMKARLLLELALCTLLGSLTMLELASWNLQGHALESRAILVDQEDAVLVIEGDDADGARMADDAPRPLLTVGQLDVDGVHTEEPPIPAPLG